MPMALPPAQSRFFDVSYAIWPIRIAESGIDAPSRYVKCPPKNHTLTACAKCCRIGLGLTDLRELNISLSEGGRGGKQYPQARMRENAVFV